MTKETNICKMEKLIIIGENVNFFSKPDIENAGARAVKKDDEFFITRVGKNIPTVKTYTIGQKIPPSNNVLWDSFTDVHRIPTTELMDEGNLDVAFEKGILGNYSSNEIIAKQSYRFQDTVLMDSGWKYFPDIHIISKIVYKNPSTGKWEYSCRKDGCTPSVRILPYQTP